MREDLKTLSTERLILVYESLIDTKKFLYSKYDIAKTRKIRHQIVDDIDDISSSMDKVLAELTSRGMQGVVINTTPYIEMERKYSNVKSDN